jgi:hypothetical protein
MNLVFYSRTGCHLCEQAFSELNRFLAGCSPPIGVDMVDVDSCPGLQARYGDKVPVIEAAGNELCRYFFDEDRVRDFLSRP